MAAFDSRAERDPERGWLLHCEGMQVEALDGLVGRVVEPLYRHSARWDRPWALAVRGELGLLTVPVEAIASVDRAAGRVRLDRASGELRTT
jgi:hypothetical protein